MHLKIPAGLSAPLLLSSFAAILAGCPTGTAYNPAAAPPSVVAVYAVDNINGTMSDIALYLAADPNSPTGKARVSAHAPASYGAYRVEVDQSLDGSTVTQLESLNLGGSGAYSACTQSTTVQFIDVDGGGKDAGGATIPASTPIPSSICYNPSTVVGSNPHIDITVGGDTKAANVFTCQSFASTGGLTPAHTYAIKFNSGVKGDNGQALKTPDTGNTGAGAWSSGTFTFKTADLEIVGAGYYDSGAGYFHFLSKPSAGYLKDLSPEDPNVFRQITTGDPFLIYTTANIATDSHGVIVKPDGTPAITVTRKSDGSTFPTSIDTFTYGLIISGFGATDGRVIAISPAQNQPGCQDPNNNLLLSATGSCLSAGTWEPNVSYVVNVDPGLTSADTGNTLGTAASYTFKAADAPLAAIDNQIYAILGIHSTSPFNGAVSVSPTASLQTQFQSPVDPATVTADNIKLTDSSGAAVPIAILPPDPVTNNQIITVKLASGTRLKPETKYTLTMNNLKGPAQPTENASKPFQPYSATFTTVTFQLSRIAKSATSTTNQDRRFDVDPRLLVNGNLKAVFNNTPTGVSATSLHLSELAADGTPTDLGAKIITGDSSGAPTHFGIQAPSTYVIKFGTRYQVKADQSITDPNSVALKQDGCIASSCPDTRVFQTKVLLIGIGNIASDNGLGTTVFDCAGTVGKTASCSIDPATGNFNVSFGLASPTGTAVTAVGIDPTSLGTQLPTGAAGETGKMVAMYLQNADGSLTNVPIKCTATGGANPTGASCSPVSPLTPNKPYVVTTVVSTTSPLKVTPTLTDSTGTYNVDTTTGSYNGILTQAFISACPP